MGFPFRSPFDSWVKEVLRQRQNDPLKGVYRNPFAVLSSTARVVKGNYSDKKTDQSEILNKLITEGFAGYDEYKGCIIANNISSLDLSYKTTKTAVGVDFNGKIIEVESEIDRRVSTPIIESIDIDGDGANNTLKTANVTVRCFTLKQLELFELFFMKPGMNVLLEFGDNILSSGLIKKLEENNGNKLLTVYRDGEEVPIQYFSSVEQALITGKKLSFDDYVDEVGKFFRIGLEGTKSYFQKIESTLGSYDIVSGKVLGFNFSIEPDLTYLVTLEISQSNQISLALPFNPQKISSVSNTPATNNSGVNEYNEREQIIDFLCMNFSLDKLKFVDYINNLEHPEGKDWITSEIFNFNKIDTTAKEKEAEATPYISLRFILYVLMNYSVATTNADPKTFLFNLPKYRKAKRTEKNDEKNFIDIIPVLTKSNIISTSDMIIYPNGKLPSISATGKDGKILFNKNSTKNGKINDYDFIYSGDLYLPINDAKFVPSKNYVFGNALNIFVKYEEVARIWNQQLYRIDFLEKILELINSNSFGLFYLIYASTNGVGGDATIIDGKFTMVTATSQNQNVTFTGVRDNNFFRFKLGPGLGTESSIIKSFNFNFEMSNLIAGQTVFNANNQLAAMIKNKKEKPTNLYDLFTNDLERLPDTFRSVSMTTVPNSDGWFSINYGEYKNIENRLQDQINSTNQYSKSTQDIIASDSVYTPNTDQKTTNEEKEKEKPDYANIVNTKSLKFKYGKGDIRTLIYKDYTFVYNNLFVETDEKGKDKKSESAPTITPIDITLVIDGFSGFRCGHCFKIDGIPEIYNMNGVFQITNIKHNLSTQSGWTTTIEASYYFNN